MLKLKDSYTFYHSRNVAELSYLIASEMDESYRTREIIGIAGLLHDIGKILVPDSILKKTFPLTEEEFNIVKRHAKNGYEILSNIKRLVELEIPELVLYHHERVDGNGYERLYDKEIPIGAKIIAVADSYDAMTTKRVYRNTIQHEDAIKEIKTNIGKQFDEDVVLAFCRVLKKEKDFSKLIFLRLLQ